MTACLVLTLLLAGELRPLPEAPADPTLEFNLHTVNGLAGTGPIERIGDDWSVSLAGEKPIHASGTELISLRRAAQNMPAWPSDEHLLFTNGDRLSGTAVELRAERLRLQASVGKGADMTVPLTAVAVI